MTKRFLKLNEDEDKAVFFRNITVHCNFDVTIRFQSSVSYFNFNMNYAIIWKNTEKHSKMHAQISGGIDHVSSKKSHSYWQHTAVLIYQQPNLLVQALKGLIKVTVMPLSTWATLTGLTDMASEASVFKCCLLPRQAFNRVMSQCDNMRFKT